MNGGYCMKCDCTCELTPKYKCPCGHYKTDHNLAGKPADMPKPKTDPNEEAAARAGLMDALRGGVKLRSSKSVQRGVRHSCLVLPSC